MYRKFLLSAMVILTAGLLSVTAQLPALPKVPKPCLPTCYNYATLAIFLLVFRAANS